MSKIIQNGILFVPIMDGDDAHLLMLADQHEILLRVALGPHSAKLVAHHWVPQPRSGQMLCSDSLVPLYPQFATKLIFGKEVEIDKYPATELDTVAKKHPLDDHFYVLDRPQRVNREQIYCKADELRLHSISHQDAVPRPRKPPSGGDSLTPLIWETCYSLDDDGCRVTPGSVMAELKRRAESSDISKKGCLVGATAGGVKYENGQGTEKELNAAQLQQRINEWKKKATQQS